MAESEISGSPLWKYMDKGEKTSGGGGNISITCKFCQFGFSGSYSRVKAHLLHLPLGGIHGCKKVDFATLQSLIKEDEDAKKRKVSALDRARSVSLPPPEPGQFRKFEDSNIGNLFKLNVRDEMDCKLARMFYASALSFNLVKSPYFRDAIIFAASNNLVGYTPPSYNKLRTTHLLREKDNIEKKLKTIKSSWARTGVTIASDGWTDVQRRPLINFMAVSQSGPMFLKAIDASGEFKDAEFMAGLFKDVIFQVGVEKVVQLITDNAPVCRAAGMIVEREYPTVFWTPCVVHTLNLALKNICSPETTNYYVYEQCSWILDIETDARMIRNFIVNHSMSLSTYSKFSSLKLLGMADTRFASTIQMLARFLEVKLALESLVMSEHWKTYKESKDIAILQKTARIKECIVSDKWWDKVDYVVEFTNPIVSMLRECDKDKPTLHKVYEMWDSTIEKVKDAIFTYELKAAPIDISEFWDAVKSVLISRWTKNNTPLHCLAHSLNPKYYSDEWLSEDDARVSPHMDQEIATNREACFRRLFPDDERRRIIRRDFGKFSGGVGDFGTYDAMADRYAEDPLVWWDTNGSSTPMLQSLAAKLLSQPASSSCCERNWSTYSNVHTTLRNKLTSERAESLVYVHSNLRLLSRGAEDYKDGPSSHWDALSENINLEEGSALQDAQIYLDEPSLQPCLFDEEIANGQS